MNENEDADQVSAHASSIGDQIVGADDGTRTRTLTEKQIFVPLRLSPPPPGVRGLDCPFAMARRL